jgi:site-specific recombinase XerD
MLYLLYSTGMRVSELIALKMEDVDLDAETIRISMAGSKKRIARLNTLTLEAVKNYLQIRKEAAAADPAAEQHRAKGALFINRFGKPVDARSADRRIARYMQDAGLDSSIRPYHLRHCYAYHLLKEGAKLSDIQQTFGFVSQATAKAYADLFSDKK